MRTPRVTLLDAPRRKKILDFIGKVAALLFVSVISGTIMAVIIAFCWKITYTALTWAF